MEVQSRLRDELLTVGTENPTMDELNSLPYLDMVIRETLRVHSPVMDTARAAMKDDILPLNKPFMDRKGRMCHGIRYVLDSKYSPALSFQHLLVTFGSPIFSLLDRINKGEIVIIPILAVNRDKSIWGEDAMEFRSLMFWLVQITVYLSPHTLIDQKDGNQFQKLRGASQAPGATCLPS